MAAQDGKAGTPARPLVKQSLDKDLTKIATTQQASLALLHRTSALGFAFLFLILAALLASSQIGAQGSATFIIGAAVLGGYMALNIGANDVANNVAPAVGSRAITLVGALVIAAIFEAAGALIAGGDVVSTISKGIIDPSLVPNSTIFVNAMMAALLAAALWINLATYVGAPVSTTHSIVGGVMGAGIAAVGVGLVNWATMAKIAASWVISPVLGGIVAALFLAFIKINVIYQEDKVAAAKRWVPVLIAIMGAAFSSYLVMKGLKRVWRPDIWSIAAIAVGSFLVLFAIVRPWVARKAVGMENRNQSLRTLFHLPLICSAALLSFAHGSNDVANAVGPLAAILHTASSGGIATEVNIPIWVMLIGALGIAAGLFLFGPKLIRMVGEQITKMNPMRAFCVALSAALTVIVASGFGLPVSSTHIAVGAVFGVGFFREYYTSRSERRRTYVNKHVVTKQARPAGSPPPILPRKLVRRAHFMTIIAAWLITVPAAALLAAALFFILSHLI